MKTSITLGILATLILAGCASMASSPAPAKAAAGMLTNPDGMTLYTFDKDAAGKSACNGPCAVNWPPLLASDDAKNTGDYGIIARDDGKKQWTYKGKPLYTWIKDQKPGDKTGDGFNNNVWHAAMP
jgi:predicted lipoprotein with Yx(FWY)xxD motif